MRAARVRLPPRSAILWAAPRMALLYGRMCYNGGASLPRLVAAHVLGSVLGTPALRRATIAVRSRRSATSTGERPSLSLVTTHAPRAKSSGTTRSMPAAAARCRKVVA